LKIFFAITTLRRITVKGEKPAARETASGLVGFWFVCAGCALGRNGSGMSVKCQEKTK
jgi:hypothetical protein